jgi:LacI family transcriptional regulator
MNPLTIGVLLDPDLDYGVGVLEGVRAFARTQAAAWRVLPLGQAQEPLLPRLVRSGDLQGLIGAFVSDRWLRGRFAGFVPLVNTSNLSHVTSVCSVVPDDAAVGRAVARHFCELNVGHAACLSDRATWASQVRRTAFVEALRERGLPVEEPDCGEAFRYEAAWQHWAETRTQATAVFCTSDALARRFHLMAKGLAPAVAQQVSMLAGAGDSLTERVVAGLDLTSVPLPARGVGLRAAERLAKLLAGDREIVCETVLPEPIVVRGSTARVAASDDVVARALGIALQTQAQNLSMDELARRSGVSRRTLELRFRRAFGRGPARELRSRRLELAQRLLVETDLSVAAVAHRCGCGSVQAFTTLFRRAVGHPPAEHRRAAAVR